MVNKIFFLHQCPGFRPWKLCLLYLLSQNNLLFFSLNKNEEKYSELTIEQLGPGFNLKKTLVYDLRCS